MIMIIFPFRPMLTTHLFFYFFFIANYCFFYLRFFSVLNSEHNLIYFFVNSFGLRV